MIISLNWLAAHLDLTGLSVEDISRLLTFAGVEVEGIESRGVTSEQVVIAQIVEFSQHPDADKLSVCRVDAGQAEPFQIVCGAKNFKAGDRVPLALEGAVLPGGITIKRGKLRGVESQGMMCSGRELGLTQDGEGLLILPADAPVGTKLGAYLGSDTILEIEVTPNRPDLLSHRGLARELAALTGRPLLQSVETPPATVPERAAATGEIRIQAPERAPLYTARIIRGVKVAPSPEWLRGRLEAIGLRPINNVVDITNFILHELGQPLHAFDLAKVDGGIVVRTAAEGEAFTTLTGQEVSLLAEDLVIADQKRALALAGVMGGLDSGVTDATTDILLESAWFQPSGIRRTSRRLALSSDSSYRFERGVDPAGIPAASHLATALILSLAGGTASADLASAGAAPVLTGIVPLEPAQVARLLGADIPAEEIDTILTRLGLTKTATGWSIPSCRQDLQRPVDLIEEVARVYGLERIPSRTAALFAEAGKQDASYDFQLRLKHQLAALGYHEARTIKLISEKQLADTLGYDRRRLTPLPLKNPLSDDHTQLRPSLVPGLLGVAAHNLRHGAAALRFFETGTVFAKLDKPGQAATESQCLALLLSGPHVPGSWLKKAPFATDLADLAGVVQAIVPLDGLKFKKIDHPLLVLAAEISVGGKTIGLGGMLLPSRARALDARHPVYVAEFSLTALEAALVRPVQFEDLQRFPSISRDVALEMPVETTHGQVAEFFGKLNEPLLAGVDLFDVFSDPTGEKLPAGRKSLAYTLTYRDKARTLETKEVDTVHARILEAVKTKLGVSVR